MCEISWPVDLHVMHNFKIKGDVQFVSGIK
jgi:hypothetical protein